MCWRMCWALIRGKEGGSEGGRGQDFRECQKKEEGIPHLLFQWVEGEMFLLSGSGEREKEGVEVAVAEATK